MIFHSPSMNYSWFLVVQRKRNRLIQKFTNETRQNYGKKWKSLKNSIRAQKWKNLTPPQIEMNQWIAMISLRPAHSSLFLSSIHFNSFQFNLVGFIFFFSNFLIWTRTDYLWFDFSNYLFPILSLLLCQWLCLRARVCVCVCLSVGRSVGRSVLSRHFLISQFDSIIIFDLIQLTSPMIHIRSPTQPVYFLSWFIWFIWFVHSLWVDFRFSQLKKQPTQRKTKKPNSSNFIYIYIYKYILIMILLDVETNRWSMAD